jgi:hypothetical protein
MGTMKSGYDRRDEVLGARLREAMEDLASGKEPDFAAIELSAGPRNAMPASGKAGRRRVTRNLLLLPAAAALAVVVGLGWNRLSGARATEDPGDPGLAGTLALSSPEEYSGDPLGMEVSLLARESVGGDRSLPSLSSGVQDAFHEEISVFVVALWDGAGNQDSKAPYDPGEGGY